MLGRLGDYLVARAPGADGREVILQLAPAVGAKVDVHDNRIVVVDLARSAAGSAPVELRMGLHDGYARIVFDWAVPISFAITGADRHWRILFDREGRIDAGVIGRPFPDLVDQAQMSRGAGRSELELALKAGVTPRIYELSGERVVVDLYPTAGAPPTAPVDPAASAAAAADPAQATPSEPAAVPAETAPVGAPAAPSEAAPPVPLVRQKSAAEVEPSVALDFTWSRPVPAAFLLRAGYLWAVFAPPTEDPGARCSCRPRSPCRAISAQASRSRRAAARRSWSRCCARPPQRSSAMTRAGG